MSEVFVARPGVLRPVDKAALRKAGIVVVEANHGDVKFLRADTEIDSGQMLRCAIKALALVGDGDNRGTQQRREFVQLLANYFEASCDQPTKV